MKWFGRKAKAAMRVFEHLINGDRAAATITIGEWKADADRRAAQ